MLVEDEQSFEMLNRNRALEGAEPAAPVIIVPVTFLRW